MLDWVFAYFNGFCAEVSLFSYRLLSKFLWEFTGDNIWNPKSQIIKEMFFIQDYL